MRCRLAPSALLQSLNPLELASISLHNSHRFTLSPLFALGRSGFGCATGWLSAFGAYRCSAPYGRYPTAGAYSYKPSLRYAYRHIALVWSNKSGVARSGRGYAPSLARSYLICAVSASAVRLASSWVLLGRGRLSLPAVALPLSPSLASPPPSLRSGTSPQGDFICLVGVVRAAIPAPPTAQPTYRHARKAVRSFFVRCGLRPPLCAQRTSDRKKWGPPPHFYFLSDNRFALSLRGV